MPRHPALRCQARRAARSYPRRIAAFGRELSLKLQLGVAYYETLNPSKIITVVAWIKRLAEKRRVLKEKHSQCYSRLDKIILHDNARPHVAVPVKNYLKILD
ncbi:hypothetical protein EVAR_44890_1 [Eumeta japonica]|uniref:Mariner Mos1 transposase n=1 Tax=Eumeta variegata TaxID=151549 RepID=A0A4C1XNK5_EUMVA|nr:hypothetical protein EVAR_44890_1 [Eumeta japonica]